MRKLLCLKFSGDNQPNTIVATVFVTDADDKDWRRHMLPPLSKIDVNSLPDFLTAAQYAASENV